VVASALSLLRPSTGESLNSVPFVDVLAVDIVIAPGGTAIGMAAPGSGTVVVGTLDSACTPSFCNSRVLGNESGFSEPTSVAFDGAGQSWVLTREPALRLANSRLTTAIPLPGAPRQHTGHRIFHTDSGGGIACASCHPEGREDGRVWDFFPVGPRRTMSVSGGILSRAPYHWSGDEPTLGALMDDVFVHRMNGGQTSDAQNQLVGQWLDGLPFPAAPPAADAAAVSRGQAIFMNPSVGCASCHAGPLFTNDAVVDVGTGGRFKVPALKGLWARAPYLHSGCAQTLADRFSGCATPQHGNISGLVAQDISDLIAYLETL
jgi:cytochrome c peroxidase